MLTSTRACFVGGITDVFVVTVDVVIVVDGAVVVFEVAGVDSPVCSCPLVERASAGTAVVLVSCSLRTVVDCVVVACVVVVFGVADVVSIATAVVPKDGSSLSAFVFPGDVVDAALGFRGSEKEQM